MKKSKRGFYLILTNDSLEPTITVELWGKWYNLFIVTGDLVTEVPFPMLDDFKESPFVDHVPNPRCVVEWAKRNSLKIDELALEMMIGRWEFETRHSYDDLDLL